MNDKASGGGVVSEEMPFQKLWVWFAANHDMHLTDTELHDIVDAVGKYNASTAAARIAELEKTAYEVPLCADHAAAWFTERRFKTGDCWFCQQNLRIAELEEALEKKDNQ